MNKSLHLTILAVIISVGLLACAGTKKTAVTKNSLKGSWYVQSTSVEGVEGNYDLRITSFDDAALSCFTESQWYLPFNGYGNYNITQSNCDKGERQILWSLRSSGGKTFFNFKKMDGVKKSDSKKVSEGYSLEVTDGGPDFFTAKSPVQFEGKTIYIVYNFKRK